MRQIILLKIDTSGMNSEDSIKHTQKCKEEFKSNLNAEELDKLCVIALPAFEGNLTDVAILPIDRN